MSATESDAKLRRLRAFVVERERRYHESLTRADLQEFVGEMGVTWRQRANEDALILSEIDRLLAEPEPATCGHEWTSGRYVFRCSQRHGHGDALAHWTTDPPVRRRETLEQEIARLYTHEEP